MYAIEAVGATALSGSLTVMVITGFIRHLAAHGVEPVPDPSPPTAPKRTERIEYFRRYNERYLSVCQFVFRAAAVVAVVGLALLVVGAFA